MTLNDMFFGLLEGGNVKGALKTLGIIAVAVLMVVIMFDMETWEWILFGALLAIALLLDFFFDKLKKKREEEPWNHSGI